MTGVWSVSVTPFTNHSVYGLKNNVIRCYFEIHMLSVVNYHGPGLIERSQNI